VKNTNRKQAVGSRQENANDEQSDEKKLKPETWKLKLNRCNLTSIGVISISV
jgi:hypothetical protein